MALPVFDVKELKLGFLPEIILEKIQFSIEEGESFVFIGPSGHGKTILLKSLAGLFSPLAGTVSRNCHIQNIGMLFQKNALFDYLSVGDNIAFPLREASSLSSEEIEKNVDKYLDLVGIFHAKHLFPDQISGGMQKRLGIARALALRPKVLLLDDPTAGLDPVTSRKIVELIKGVKKQSENMTIVAVCSDIHQAFSLADRLALVVNKQVIVTGSRQETLKLQNDLVRQFIFGELHGPLSELA